MSQEKQHKKQKSHPITSCTISIAHSLHCHMRHYLLSYVMNALGHHLSRKTPPANIPFHQGFPGFPDDQRSLAAHVGSCSSPASNPLATARWSHPWALHPCAETTERSALKPAATVSAAHPCNCSCRAVRLVAWPFMICGYKSCSMSCRCRVCWHAPQLPGSIFASTNPARITTNN